MINLTLFRPPPANTIFDCPLVVTPFHSTVCKIFYILCLASGDQPRGSDIHLKLVEKEQSYIFDGECSRHGFLHQRMNANGSDTKWFIFLEQ
jgi:hypothetical protein